ncbi:MAG: response regulator [Spirochaetaceae bacterium]|jgi:CheY-like chemotaxis protein|nr:response regulator [Spirochaetaceae bacterium]
MSGRKKILIVDDEQINLEFFDLMLSKLGFIVERAENGAEALEKVKHFYPDLIILDNIMPKISGWEVTKTLKKDPAFREIPIIMFSALDDVKDKVEGFNLGVDDYITKPYNFSEVLARIRAVLRNRELLGQIVVRDVRLNLAEEFSRSMKREMEDFIKSMDNLDAVIAQFSQSEGGSEGGIDRSTLSRLLDAVREKSAEVRKQIAGLDARIERTIAEWEGMKQNEIGLTVLEKQIRNSLNEE